MTLRELELFYHLCKAPHISKLSQKLNMSQSAISLAIKSLEQKLGDNLFDRIGKKLILNERGRLFYKESYQHFLALKDIEKNFQKEKLSGILKIASSKTIGNFIIPPILYDFHDKNPHITLQKDIKNSTQIIQLLLQGEIDMGIIEGQYNEPNLIQIPLTKDRLILVSSDKDLATSPRYIDELFEKKWLLREEGSGTRQLFLERLGNMAKSLHIFMEFTEFEEMKTLLLRHKEILTCVSLSVVQKEINRGELHEITLTNIDLSRDLTLLYHKEKYRSTLFITFEEFIKQELSKEIKS